MSIKTILSKATLDSLEKAWTELNWLKNHSRLPENEDLNIAITAVERLREEMLPKYYVFACESCDRIYCAEVEALQKILDVKCPCAVENYCERSDMLFMDIVTGIPLGSTELKGEV